MFISANWGFNDRCSVVINRSCSIRANSSTSCFTASSDARNVLFAERVKLKIKLERNLTLHVVDSSGALRDTLRGCLSSL